MSRQRRERFAIYETVSCEGSPVTPEFGSVDEAIDYAAEHCTVMRRRFSRDEWVRRLDYPEGMKPLT